MSCWWQWLTKKGKLSEWQRRKVWRILERWFTLSMHHTEKWQSCISMNSSWWLKYLGECEFWLSLLLLAVRLHLVMTMSECFMICSVERSTWAPPSSPATTTLSANYLHQLHWTLIRHHCSDNNCGQRNVLREENQQNVYKIALDLTGLWETLHSQDWC